MSVSFLLLSIILVFSAIAVVVLRNPIHSALALIIHLVGVAAVFASLDAHFLAIIQIIVYAGAIMVLVLFVLMLLNVKNESRTRASVLSFIVAGITGSCFIAILMKVNDGFWSSLSLPMFQPQSPVREGSVELIGQLLYSKYLLPFEASSLLLMAAVVGATMMAKSRTKDGVSPSSGDSK